MKHCQNLQCKISFSYRCKLRVSQLGLKVKALTQTMWDAGSSPAQCSSFLCQKIALRDNYLLIKIILLHDICMPVWEVHTNGYHFEQMFQMKINEIFKDVPNVCCSVDDILFAGYKADGKDHDGTV